MSAVDQALPRRAAGERPSPATVGWSGSASSLPASFLIVAAVVLVAALGLPYALIEISPSVARLLFPAYALIMAALVLHRYPAAYPVLCIAISAFAPFLRRIADFHAGFVQTNPILLGSLVVLLPTLPSLARRILTPGAALAGPLAMMVGCLLYGSVIALCAGKLVQGLYEPAWWLLPPALATFIMERPEQIDAIRRATIQSLIIIIPILTVYGVLQYISPQAWDIVWMLNVDNSTFGKPMPYEVRVFSMMNSPGIAAMFTAYSLLLLCGGGVVAVLVALASLPLLLLTLLRTAWLAAAVGLSTLLVLAPVRQRFRLVLAFVIGFVALTVLFGSPAIPVTLKNMVMDRANSFTTLGSDTSANDRRDTYASFYDRLAKSPLGEGFGANGSATSVAQKRDLPPLDSGILEIFLTFGIPVGIVYFYSMAALVAAAWRGLRRSRGALASCFAVVGATVAIMPLGLVQVGETGAIQWTAIGLLLAAAVQGSGTRPGKARPG